jgi:hypothetical protein
VYLGMSAYSGCANALYNGTVLLAKVFGLDRFIGGHIVYLIMLVFTECQHIYSNSNPNFIESSGNNYADHFHTNVLVSRNYNLDHVYDFYHIIVITINYRYIYNPLP